MPEVTAFFAGVMLLMQLVFGVIVSANRGRLNIATGDGGNQLMHRHIRVHGNFTENVPVMLIAMGLAELIGTSSAVMWTGGLLLVVSRLAHPASLHKVGGIASVILGAGINYLLLALWGIYLIGHWAGIIPVL